MPLTLGNIATLKAFVQASVVPAIVAARAAGATAELAALLNADAAGPVLAWRKSVQPVEADDAPNYTQFDALAVGLRDSWKVFCSFPRDFTRNRTRSWVTDVWGVPSATNSNGYRVLNSGVENASVAEVALGGSDNAEGTGAGVITAKTRSFVGDVTQEECQKILA